MFNVPGGNPYRGGPPGQSPKSDALDLHAILRVLRRRLRLIGLFVVAGVALSVVIALSLVPMYKATSSILVAESQDDVLAGANETPNFNLLNDKFIETQVEIIRSDVVFEGVINRLGLDLNPEFNSSLEDAPSVNYLNPLSWIGAIKALAAGGDESEVVEGDVLRRQILESIKGKVSIGRVDLTSVIDVTAVSINPATAQDIANGVADQYLETQLNIKFEETDKATSLLSERLTKLRNELGAKERAVVEFAYEHNLIDDATGTTIDEQTVIALNNELALIDTEITEKESRLRQVEELIKSRSLDAVTTREDSIAEVLESRVVIELRRQQADVIRRRAELSTRYKPNHPQMIEVTRELEDLEAQIRNAVGSIVDNLANEVDVARAKKRSLAKTLRERNAELAAKAPFIATLEELKREAESTRTVYETLLTRFNERVQRQEWDTVDARILSSATKPIEPFRPKRTVIVLAGLFISALMGVATVLVLEALAPGIRTPEDLEGELGLTHLASVPKIDDSTGAQRPYRYMLRNPLASFSEVYRTLVATVTLADRESSRQVVLFTSALPSEGKTTNALCFALSAARSGKRTVLVEADMRMPKVTWHLDMNFDMGLAEVLRGEADVYDVLKVEPETELAVLGLHEPIADPSRLLSDRSFEELITTLRDNFDIVVLDTAPILPVGDTLQMAHLADHIIFGVRARSTARGDVAVALKELAAAKARILGGVVTFADPANRRAYGYGNYGYAKPPGSDSNKDATHSGHA